MLRVIVEYHPSHGGSRADIAELEIVNVGTNSKRPRLGDYAVQVKESLKGRTRGTQLAYYDFPRQKAGPLRLLHEILGELLKRRKDA